MSLRCAIRRLSVSRNAFGRSSTTSFSLDKQIRCASAIASTSANAISTHFPGGPGLLFPRQPNPVIGSTWEAQQRKGGARSFGCQSSSQESAGGEPFEKATEIFPGSLTNSELLEKISATLEQQAGFQTEKTLVATSLCCDEVNRPLEVDLAHVFTSNFNMGGLAGFPFGGATSFGAMAAHIPDGGSCLVVYGPHVGVDSSGAVGTVERRGRTHGGSCCGSAVAASNYVSGVHTGEVSEASMPEDALDAQQYFVGKMLLPYAEKLENASDKMVQLPHSLYEAQSELIERIVKASAAGVGDGSIALLGGIQINTPPGFTDYFLPKRFDLYDSTGEMIKQLW